MSLRALLWVVDDPRSSELHASALRVLLALADHAHEDGTAAWVSASRMAERLTLSERTVERCLKQLREMAMIRRGDQSLVASRRADRRPRVWDLDVDGSGGAALAALPTDDDDGDGADAARAVTDDGPSDQQEHAMPRAVTDDGPSMHGPSRNSARAVTGALHGPTPGVGQNRPLTTRNRPGRAASASARSAARSGASDLAALDDVEALAYCRQCGGQHTVDASCSRANLPVPAGGLRALVQASRSAS